MLAVSGACGSRGAGAVTASQVEEKQEFGSAAASAGASWLCLEGLPPSRWLTAQAALCPRVLNEGAREGVGEGPLGPSSC